MTARNDDNGPPPIAIFCHLNARHFYLVTHCDRDEANGVLARQATCHVCGSPLEILEQQPAVVS